ncbi:MAG: T9SS type A sorting domain-containing protein, partial [Syntrophothermus sp.]
YHNWSDKRVPTSADNVFIINKANAAHVTSVPATPAVCNNLIIESGAVLTIDPGKALTVSGNTVLNGSECLILKANATGYASFIDNGISGTGTMKAECYLVPDQYHYISAPISNATANVFQNDYLRASDPTTTEGWATNYIVDPATPLQPARGYFAWKPSGNSTAEAFSGTPNTGLVSISLNRTATDPWAGWHLVGNPYPSSMDLENGINWGNFENTAYFFDPVANNYTVYETWGSYGTHDQYCPPQQGFFAHIDDASGNGNTTLSFNNTSRVHNSVSFLKQNRELADFLLLTVTGNVNAYSDKAIVHFDENVTAGFDKGYDGYKLAGTSEAPQLYTLSANKKLTCNSLPFDAKNISVPMGFSCGVSGTFTIMADSLGTFANNSTISLEDKKLNVFTDLKQSAQYSFGYTTNENPDRFVLHFYNPNIGTGDLAGASNIQIFTSNNQLIVRLLDSDFREGLLQVYDMTGRLVYHERIAGENTRISLSLAGGYYLAKVTTAKALVTEKILIK